jgi:molybdopterin-guanine dinucleotide biosynthesis protein A
MQQPDRSAGQPASISHAAPAGTASQGIDRALITGVILAGGRGARMGGLDKGLQLYGDAPLAQHALRRLQAQVGPALINANRNLAQYQSFAVPVITDTVPDFAGPLAGFITAMENCRTPYLMTVPCDTPQFPMDLVPRLALALAKNNADVAMASALETQANGTPAWYRQPVFCLLKIALLPNLRVFVADGGRKIGAWTAQQHTVQVEFDEPGAFANVNTLAQLQALQT